MNERVGFIGLGLMGHGMAASLVRAGYDVTVYNRTKAKAQDLASMGAKISDSPADAARGAGVVFTMVADPPAIDLVVFGPGGVMETLEAGSVLIDCSTVDPATTTRIRKAAEAKGAKSLDCPVGGSRDAAEAGELILMVGGDAETLEQVRPYLEAVGKKIVHAGPSGSGTMLKLCFNLCVSHTAAAIAETLVLGAKAGLKPEVIIDTLMSGTLASRFYEWKGGCIAKRDFTTNFSTQLMHKDTGLIMNAGETYNVPLPVTAAVKELFTMAKGHGQANEDFSSVVKVLEDLAHVEVKGSGD